MSTRASSRSVAVETAYVRRHWMTKSLTTVSSACATTSAIDAFSETRVTQEPIGW